MKVEYKDRGIFHKLMGGKLSPINSKHLLVRITGKAVLGTETALLFVKDLAVNRFVGKELHIKFERKADKKGKYRTHIKLIRVEATERPQGILHKLFSVDRFFEGDVPFQKRQVKYKPKTIKGKIAYGVVKAPFKAAKYVIKYDAKAAKVILLTSETAVLKAGSAAIDRLGLKLRNESDMHDGGKVVLGSITALRLADRGRKYIIRYRQQRKQFKQLKTAFKGQKYKLKSLKKTYKSEKKKINIERQKQKLKLKNNRNNKKSGSIDRKTYRKRAKVIRGKIKYQKQLKKSAKKIVKNQKKIKKSDKKKLKKAKPAPIPLAAVSAGTKGLSRKLNEKLEFSAADNDFVQAYEKTRRITKEVSSVTSPAIKKLKQKGSEMRRNHLHKQANKLKAKNVDMKKNRRKHIKRNQSFKKRMAENTKKAGKKIVKIAADFTKFAFKSFAVFLMPVISVALAIAILLSVFTGAAGNNAYVLGTYNAQDYDLSRAIEEYTKIAYEYNQNILKCSTDEWKTALNSLGINTSNYPDNPNVFKFGRSTYLQNNVADYDFDPDILAAFMCAYTYDFSRSDYNVENWCWDDSYIDVLKKLFKTEYTFLQYYDNKSGWRELSRYEFYGSKSSYHSVWKENFTKTSMKAKAIPSVIRQFCTSDNMIHYNCNTLEILDANNNDKQTGYFIQDQRYAVTDTSGNSNEPFYHLENATQSDVNQYIKDGIIYYTSELEIKNANDNMKVTGYFINKTTKIKPYKIYSFNKEQASGPPKLFNRSGFAFDDLSVFWVVTPNDTKTWMGRDNNDICLISFYRKNYWYNDCTLYYNVKSNCNFTEACKSLLRTKDEYIDERLNFFGIMTSETTGNGAKPYGNHQMLNSPVGGKSYSSIENRIYNGYGYDVDEWNKEHCSITDCHKGLDISAARGSAVYSMCNGYVNWIDTEKNSMSIITSYDYSFWYDDNAFRPMEIIYTNISTTLNTGDEVKQGAAIGKVTDYRHCYDGSNDLDNNKSTKYYLHIIVKIDYSNNRWWTHDWKEVDPHFLIYRSDDEAK